MLIFFLLTSCGHYLKNQRAPSAIENSPHDICQLLLNKALVKESVFYKIFKGLY